MAMPMPKGSVPPVVTAAELENRVRSKTAPLLVDVREPGEYFEGHIPGSANYPLSRFTTVSRDLDPNQEIILICRSGNRSGMAQRYLMAQGYNYTRNMIDGMIGWSGPVE